MSATLTLTQGFTGGGITGVSGLLKAYTGSLLVFEEEIPAGATVYQIQCPLDVSQLVAFGMHSNKPVTVSPFDGGGATADDPIELAAREPETWGNEAHAASPFTEDITHFKVANPASEIATLKMIFCVDPTL